jgi:hypothetical protein
MLSKYLTVFKKHFVILFLLLALIVVSSVTKGNLSVVTAYAAGALMIYAAISFTLWIIKTPSKKTKEEVA